MSGAPGATPAEIMAKYLEPAAVAVCGIREDTVLTASIAISLRRIADLFEGDDKYQGIATTLFYMEQRLGPQS